MRLSGFFSATSDGSTILARPFISAINNLPTSVLIAFPALSNGSVSAESRSGNLIGGNVDLKEEFCNLGWIRFNSLLGYRFLRYDDAFAMIPAPYFLSTGNGAFGATSP